MEGDGKMPSDNGRIRSNRTSNRKLDEIKAILEKILEKL